MSDGQNSPHNTVHLLALNAALRAENENLKAVVETLRRALYAARSERQLEPADQLPLALNDLSAAPLEPPKLPRPANSNQPVAASSAQYRRPAGASAVGAHHHRAGAAGLPLLRG